MVQIFKKKDKKNKKSVKRKEDKKVDQTKKSEIKKAPFKSLIKKYKSSQKRFLDALLRIIGYPFMKILRVGKKGRQFQYLFLVFILIFLSLNLISPRYWDYATGYLNSKQGKVQFPSFFKQDFQYGLDLDGGIELMYRANFDDLTEEQKSKSDENLDAVRNVIESRVNMFGVSEAEVRTVNIGDDQGIIVSLPGITNKDQAIEEIGQTPSIDFREEKTDEETEEMVTELNQNNPDTPVTAEMLAWYGLNYKTTNLTGRYIESAGVGYDQFSGQPQVLLEFNSEGQALFSDLTEKNIGKRIGIFLDGRLISSPVVQEKIDGQAVISGMTEESAQDLKQRLNAGALPVKIELVSQRSVEATVGKKILDQGMIAGLIGSIAVIAFMIMIYRYPGLLSAFALVCYIILLLAFFKIFAVTLTLAGIAGIIFSIGIAVDANVLIFEHTKEEIKKGRDLNSSIEEGFKKSWEPIRDSNVSTLIICIILYLSKVPIMMGFAFTLGLGVLLSMFSSIVITRLLLRLFAANIKNKFVKKYLI